MIPMAHHGTGTYFIAASRCVTAWNRTLFSGKHRRLAIPLKVPRREGSSFMLAHRWAFASIRAAMLILMGASDEVHRNSTDTATLSPRARDTPKRGTICGTTSRAIGSGIVE